MFKHNKGIVLVTVYMAIVILIGLLGTYGARSISERNLARRQQESAEAFYIAEAGIQKTLWVISNNPGQINNNPWLISQANMNNNLGNGSFQVLQITGGASTKNIISAGTAPSITRRIQVQAQNSWLSKIPAAIYSKNVAKIHFDKRDDAYIDGKSMPGVYSTDEVKSKVKPKPKEGEEEKRILGNPPILENQEEVPEGLQDGLWIAFDINGLREEAKEEGTYFSGEEYNKKGKYILPVEDGETQDVVYFFDTKDGVVLDDDAIERNNEAKVELKGTCGNQMSGIIVVLGDLKIVDTKDCDFLFDGVIIVLDDLKMHDNIHHRRHMHDTNDSDIVIRGAVLVDDIIYKGKKKGKKRRKKPNVDIKNATIEYDPSAIANASPRWGIIPGTWQEI